MKSLEGTDGSVLSVQWSGTGDSIISTGSDGVMRVWDAAKAECAEAIEVRSPKLYSSNVKSSKVLYTLTGL